MVREKLLESELNTYIRQGMCLKPKKFNKDEFLIYLNRIWFSNNDYTDL